MNIESGFHPFHQSTYERTDTMISQQINYERIFWCICAAVVFCLLIPLVGCGGTQENEPPETEAIACFGDASFVGPCLDEFRWPVTSTNH